jgi:uncharacterized protein (TIGR02001 family)
MKTKLVALAVAGVLSSPALVMAEGTSPLTFNLGVTSDYLFRGVSQTHGKPAIQAGVDYAFSNGLYVGAWASNITWVKDNWGKGSLEIDVYGGYKGSITGDLGYDVGYITYNYPGKGDAFAYYANPNTQEIYFGLSYKWLSAKYSYATSSHFIGWGVGADGFGKSRGSDYIELNANYDMGDGWTLIGHVGHQKVKGFIATPGVLESADYTDWKIGVSKDVGFGIVSLAYSDTTAKGNCPSSTVLGTSAYCWGNSGAVSGTNSATSGYKDVARGTAVLTFTKAF